MKGKKRGKRGRLKTGNHRKIAIIERDNLEKVNYRLEKRERKGKRERLVQESNNCEGLKSEEIRGKEGERKETRKRRKRVRKERE